MKLRLNALRYGSHRVALQTTPYLPLPCERSLVHLFVTSAVFNEAQKLVVLCVGSRKSLGEAFQANGPKQRRSDDQTC